MYDQLKSFPVTYHCITHYCLVKLLLFPPFLLEVEVMNRLFGKPVLPILRRMSVSAKRSVAGGRIDWFEEMAAKRRTCEEFVAAFDRISTVHLNVMDHRLEEAKERYRRVLDYNCKGGKLNRGMAVLSTFQTLQPSSSEEDVDMACVVGWCVELLQAYFLIEDDIEDGSETRRDRPCWYKVPDVGLTAINDASYLAATVYQILMRHLKDHPLKWEIMKLFHDHDFRTIIGQTIDMTAIPFDKFSMERLATVYEFKTAYYSFSLPVRSAMYLAGIADPSTHENAEKILLKIGHLFQVQDDYLDCFGDPKVTGKIGTDIQDNKCTWLIMTALEQCNEIERAVLRDNYGKHSSQAIQVVKSIYEQLGIKEKFFRYEEEQYQKLLAEIKESSDRTLELKDTVFEDFLNRIYKRQK